MTHTIPVNLYFGKQFSCFTQAKSSSTLSAMDKFGKRLKAARFYANLTQVQLSDKLGGKLTQAGISYLEVSDAYGSEFTVQIADICGVDAMWLATGEGKMIDPDISNARVLMQKMSDYDRKVWLRMGNSLAEPKESKNGTH